MLYTLITRNGKIMQFYVQSVAEMYRTVNGGVIVSQEILAPETVDQKSGVC